MTDSSKRAFCVASGLICFAASSAFAGVAIFDPSPQDHVPAGTPTVTMSVTIQAQSLIGFDTVDVVFSSDVPFTFTYSSDFTLRSTGALYSPFEVGLGLRTHDLYVGGFSPTAFAYGNSISLGTIVFDKSSLPIGTYDMLISSSADTGISGITHFGFYEPLEGQGFFSITDDVPSVPAVGFVGLGIMLVAGCASAAILWRRKMRVIGP